MTPRSRAAWMRSPGVTRGLDDYVHSTPVAEDYDNYFSYSRLFAFDQSVIDRYLPDVPSRVVADLGCGTARALLPLVARGHRGVAVDLSRKMLKVAQRKFAEQSLPVDCLHANLAQLNCLSDQSVDVVLCLFSTLGMIHGRENRQTTLNHIRRILRPPGLVVLHVHNYWHRLTDPEGIPCVASNLWQSFVTKTTFRGDRYYTYRGVPQMYLHSFTRPELVRQLTAAGLRIREWIPLRPDMSGCLRMAWCGPWLRASGWIVVAESGSP